jgi:hypothetical protein
MKDLHLPVHTDAEQSLIRLSKISINELIR